MRRFAAPTLVFLLGLVALCSFVVAPAVGTPAGEADTGADQTAGQVGLFDIGDSQRILFELQPDGDATLTVSFVFEVDSDSERAAFRETATEFKQREFVWPFFNTTAESVSEKTGREMSLEGPRRSSRFNETKAVGVLTSRMTWRGFATVSNRTITVEDAFYVSEGVPWIRRLGTNQSLVLVGPDGYEFAGAPDGPRFTDERLIWDGTQRFGDGDLRAQWQREPQEMSFGPVVIGLVGLLGLVVALYAVRRYGTVQSSPETAPSPSDPVADTDGGSPAATESAADVSPATETGDETTAADTATPSASDGTTVEQTTDSTAAAEASDDETSTEAESADEIDPELLSDEERVERMLDRNGGRMKQANIVKETGWSNAKVSQLLSQMDEDDRIDKLRIGRENLISLPDEDVTTLE